MYDDTPQHEACREGQRNELSLLITRGASLHLRNKYNDTPLHVACDKGHADCVALILVQRGITRDARNDMGLTPLHYACRRNHDTCVALLLEFRADANARDDDDWTPLHYACYRGYDAVAILLLDAGAHTDVCRDIPDAVTPLHVACDGGHVRHVVCASLLLDHGADVNAPGYANETPLHVASARGRRACAARLIRGGALLDACDNDGMTPLHVACDEGHAVICNLLINAGATLDAVDSHHGDTPLSLACMRPFRQYPDCATALLNAGAEIPTELMTGASPCALLLRTEHARRRSRLARCRWRASYTWVALVGWLQMRAAHSVYAPGGVGFEDCKRRRIDGGMRP